MQRIEQPSVQSLLLQMRYGDTLLGTATGFVVHTAHGPALVTNRHVVTGRDQATGEPLSKTAGIPDNLAIWHNRHNALGQWVSKREPLYDDGQPRWREHPTLGAKADLALLPLTDDAECQLYPYDPSSPGPDILVVPSDPVSVVGFPFGMSGGGLFAIWATGFLATEPVADFGDLPVVLVDCRGRQGQSGSPVVAYRSGGSATLANGSMVMGTGAMWKFIGVYSGRVNSESDLGIVWKASAVAELVKSVERSRR